MTPHRNDLFEYANAGANIEVTIADGKKLHVTSTGSVHRTGIDGKRIRMVDVLLGRRLLSGRV